MRVTDEMVEAAHSAYWSTPENKGCDRPAIRAALEAALAQQAGADQTQHLLCWAYDNLNDMPISEKWAAEWCKQAESFVIASSAPGGGGNKEEN